MTIDFAETDLQLLREILREQLKSLLNEIAHTDDRAFRDALRLRHDQIEVIAARLGLAHTRHPAPTDSRPSRSRSPA